MILYSHAKEICVPVIPLSFYFFLHCISPWRFSSPVMLLCGAKSRHHRKVFVTCQDLSSITIITFLVGTSKTLATLPKPASTRCKPSTRFHPRQVRLMYMYYAYRNRGILDGFFAHPAIQSNLFQSIRVWLNSLALCTMYFPRRKRKGVQPTPFCCVLINCKKKRLILPFVPLLVAELVPTMFPWLA
jgi:hypothetical protein